MNFKISLDTYTRDQSYLSPWSNYSPTPSPFLLPGIQRPFYEQQNGMRSQFVNPYSNQPYDYQQQQQFWPKNQNYNSNTNYNPNQNYNPTTFCLSLKYYYNCPTEYSNSSAYQSNNNVLKNLYGVQNSNYQYIYDIYPQSQRYCKSLL